MFTDLIIIMWLERITVHSMKDLFLFTNARLTAKAITFEKMYGNNCLILIPQLNKLFKSKLKKIMTFI